jgi:hypothetical protein
LEAKLAQIQSRIDSLKSKINSLFEVEAKSKAKYQRQLEEEEERLGSVELELENLPWVQEMCQKYTRLSLEPLTWRDGQGFPQLVVFTLTHPRFAINGNLTSPDRITPRELPYKIREQFGDVVANLDQGLNSRTVQQISCDFDDHEFPDDVREKIHEAREDFSSNWYASDQILVIAQPPEWKVSEITRLPADDPIVVGWSDNDPNHLYKIATFDLTLAEELASEFID